MKNIFYCLVLIIIGIGFNNPLKCQDSSKTNPLEPASEQKILKLGVFGGWNNTLAPSIMKNSPKFGSATVQKSLLNGLDGLGFANSFNLGIYGKYSLSNKLYLGANIGYTKWGSDNSCNCQPVDSGLSQNSLSLYHFSVFAQYYFAYDFYMAPELSMNTFAVSVQENHSTRGTIDFSKNYLRIGAGLALGYSYRLAKFMELDANIKFQALNVLLAKDFNKTDTESQALINSSDSVKESIIMLVSANLGILFSLW